MNANEAAVLLWRALVRIERYLAHGIYQDYSQALDFQQKYDFDSDPDYQDLSGYLDGLESGVKAAPLHNAQAVLKETEPFVSKDLYVLALSAINYAVTKYNQFHEIQSNPVFLVEQDEYANLNRDYLKSAAADYQQRLEVIRVLIIDINKNNQDQDNKYNIDVYGELHMGDKYTANQVGAMGPKSHAHDINFNQVWRKAEESIDITKLASELSELYIVMNGSSASAEHEVSIGNVKAATKAAENGDGATALKYLKDAGSWALEIASKVGVGVAVAAIKLTLGLK